MNKRFFTMLLALIAGTMIFGQKAPISYGKVPIEDLQMTVYGPDTTAPAVILCDYGHFRASSLDFSRILRIKILKKEGYGYAERRFLTMSPPVISGITYNLVNGEIKKDKLQGSAIYTKKTSSSLYETSFAMPNVKEGSVIDISIVFPGLPFTWDFQEMIPVRHSEIVIEESSLVDFSKNFFGYTPLTINEPFRWAITNVPAFKEEPCIDSYENYKTKFEIGIRRVGTYFYNSSWENINNLLNQEQSFPYTSSIGSACLNPIINDLKNRGLQREELIKAAFDTIKKVKYNKENDLYISEEGICGRYKLLSGSSADINFMLIQILNKLDVETNPVVLSTRDNGILSQFAPSMDKLNYVIAAVKQENGYLLLDATEEYMPLTLLPDRCINGNGRLITKNGTDSKWIPITCNGKDKSLTTYDLSFDEDFSLKGTITIDYDEYAAYDFRKAFSKFNDKDEFARELEKKMPGLTINEIKVTNATDLYSPAQMKLDVRIEGMTIAADNEIYVNPMLFDAVKENPFKSPQRNYPVSYSRKVEDQVIFNLILGEGMKASVLPVQLAGKMRNNSVAFNFEVTSSASSVNIQYKYFINNLTILQTQYNELRELYNKIVKKHSEPVIITTI